MIQRIIPFQSYTDPRLRNMVQWFKEAMGEIKTTKTHKHQRSEEDLFLQRWRSEEDLFPQRRRSEKDLLPQRRSTQASEVGRRSLSAMVET